MSETAYSWSVHQNLAPLLAALCVGWVATFFGTLRWGARFALLALPAGLLIPASQFLLRAGLWRALADPEIDIWNGIYWLAPAILVACIALQMRRRRA